MLHRTTRRPQFFYTTAPMPCPYLAGRTERKIVTELTGPDSEKLHDRLSRAGFRRSHNIAYSPVCPGCQACIPIRILCGWGCRPGSRGRPASRRCCGCQACIPIRILCGQFEQDRTQRRVARANAGLRVHEATSRATAEQFALFQRYQQARHNDGDMASMGFYDYRAMVEDTPITTGIVEFRDEEDRLVAGCLTDWLSDGLSAVYSFYDPALERQSLGTFMVLWLVRRAMELRLPYVYLGYWVPQSRKMAYKARFQPSEILTGGHWRRLQATDIVQVTE